MLNSREDAALVGAAILEVPFVDTLTGILTPMSTADEKFAALEAAGVKTVRSLADIGSGLSEITGW